MIDQSDLKDATALNREQLDRIQKALGGFTAGELSLRSGVLTLPLPTEGMDQAQLLEYLSQAHVAYMHLQKELKVITLGQLNFLGREADGDAQLMFGRGGINVIDIIIQRYEALEAQFQELTNPTGNSKSTGRTVSTI